MWVQSLGQEGPLEEATRSSVFAWRTPWTEEIAGLQSIVSQRVRHTGSNLASRYTCPRPDGDVPSARVPLHLYL